MTASRPSAAALALVSACGLLAGCRTPGALPVDTAFHVSAARSLRVPDVADHTAAELAAAALASDRDGARQALGRLDAIDRVLVFSGEAPTGLLPIATDLVSASLDDELAYRSAARELLEQGDLEPGLRARVDLDVHDDPLSLADARMHDAFVRSFGRAFNAVVEPLGRSIVNTTFAPYRLGSALLQYAAELYDQDELPLQERQALGHWKEFTERHPASAEAEELAPRVRDAEARWHRTQRDRWVRASEKALDRREFRTARVYADRALRHSPEDRRGWKLREEADQRLERERANLRRSLEAPGPEQNGIAPEAARLLALALLDPAGDVGRGADELLAADPDGSLADEARFARALAQFESGRESDSWRELEKLAKRGDAESNMARHARALLESGRQHPWAAFEHARGVDRRERGLWVLAGPWARGPRGGLPGAVKWLLDAPQALQAVVTSPVRLLQLPWMPPLPSTRRAATHARSYLAQHPGGEHAAGARSWLLGYERKRENWLAVLYLERGRPEPDPERLTELSEKAARQSVQAAGREERRDLRQAMLARIAREFPDTASGRAAGRQARQEIEQATPQHIALSRGFLLENREVAGAAGLDLKPELLDDDGANGELHPDGVALIGGRHIELSYLDAAGDERAPPRRRIETISAERLARTVSLLQETAFRNELLDSDDSQDPDAQRDAFFERARLGLADDVDPRPLAASSYTYRGLRERYGMVRARESILPFDLVIQGSFTELSLGAFPRIRPPRRTPDAILYE